MNPKRANPAGLLQGWQRATTLRLLVLCLLLAGIMTWLNPGRFLTERNFASMGFQFPELGLFALAIVLSLITGGIDLSVVSTANLAGILAALVLTQATSGAFGPGETAGWVLIAAVVALGTGAAGGWLNGLLITRLGITPILATLGTMQLYLGLALVITRGPAISGYPETFLSLGNGVLLGIPVPLLIFAVTAVGVALLLGRTVLGVQLYLVGSNERAARFAGVPVSMVLRRAYWLSGLIAGLAGLLMISRTNSAKADYGASYLLQAVLVAVLGGVDPRGGKGKIRDVVLALLSLQFISSGLSLLRCSQFTKEVAWGALLLLAMALPAWRRSHDRRRRDGRAGGEVETSFSLGD